jgi:hypothetical protein
MWLGWHPPGRPPAPVVPVDTTLPVNSIAQGPAQVQSLDDRLRAGLAGLSVATDAEARRKALAQIRAELSSASSNQAAAVIRRFLDDKADATTSQGFRLGGDGLLEEAPTFRVFLLDYLQRVDPAAAADCARSILSSTDSSDEWAVALRSLAKGDNTPEGCELLSQKAGELLRNEAWQQHPSAGYLEAFDVAVFLGGTNLVPALSDLVRRQDNPAVAHAAYLALDRLVIKDTAQLLAALEAAPEVMQGREATRADYFARADVRDPQQRQVLESYLLNPQRSAAELAQFGGVFPNANYMISQNLLTPTPTPDHAALTGRDVASLQAVQEWLVDPRFANLQQPLQKVKQRLEDFARQPGR